MRFPRNFWKRGQSAYELSCRAERVTIPQLHAHPKNYLSLRESTKVLGVSHQTLTKWTTDKIVRRDGPGGKFAVGDLISFLHELEKRAKEPPPKESRISVRKRHQFEILQKAEFIWPIGRKALSVRELAALIPCHPSTLVRAIDYYRGMKWPLGRRRTPCRWEIPKTRWVSHFGT